MFTQNLKGNRLKTYKKRHKMVSDNNIYVTSLKSVIY